MPAVVRVPGADSARFAEFADRKEKASEAAKLETFKTVADHSAVLPVESISSPFSDALLDGPFFQSPASLPDVPSMSLVFVQSRNGNTVADDPSTLGGGETDKHIIYEGLSRVAADAVMAGAQTVGGGRVVFSIWHPALVALRRTLGKPRHPVQIVLTAIGELPIEQGLLFNVPEIPVVILTFGKPADRLAVHARSRPWITVMSTGQRPDLRYGTERLRRELGIRRISAIGGRSAATSLIDAGLVTDLYLTTSPIDAGEPGTPMYAGARRLDRDLVVRKRSSGGVVFEHFILTAR